MSAWRNRLERRLFDEAGFTLIELLGVAVILIVLAVMALPVYAEVSDRARKAQSYEEVRLISGMLDAYYVEKGHYPDNLYQLVEGKMLKPTTFEAPWSSDSYRVYYYYAINGTPATAYVLGAPRSGANCTVSSPDAACGRNPKEAPHSITADVPFGEFLVYQVSGKRTDDQ